MASPPSSRLRFVRGQGGAPIDAPVEWEPTWLVLDGLVSEWANVSLEWNGTPLDLQLRRSSLLGVHVAAELPRLPAGHHRFTLRYAAGSEERVVRVMPRKLDEPAFERLLVDLEEGLAQELAIALQAAGALAGVQLQPAEAPTLAGERQRLRRAIHGGGGRPGLLAILPRIAADVHEQLTHEQRWVAGLAARNVVPSQLPRALIRPGNLNQHGGLESVVDARAISTVDTYENRVVRTFADLVRGRAGRFVAACEALGRKAVAAEVTAWVRELDIARTRATFLTAVSPLPVAPSRLTMVLTRKPAYRAALEGLLAFVRSCAVRCDPTWLEAPLENLPWLYQLWGTLQVILAVLELAVRLGFVARKQRLVSTLPTGLYVQVLPDGEPALVLEHPSGATLTVTPERTFGATGRLRSITYPQRPDITIELRLGDVVELWLFDPKYRLFADSGASPGDGRPTKEDLDKMHAYRDAIRGPGDRHVVRFASTIYPGPTQRYGADLAAVKGWPGDAEALRLAVSESLVSGLEELGHWERRGKQPRDSQIEPFARA